MRQRLDMRRVCLARLVLGTAVLVHGIAAAAATSSKPLILDTQRGIQDGKGGLMLQTAPLSSEPIVEPAGMRAPAGQGANTSIPLFIAPYIDVSGAQPAGRPRPTPRPQLQP
ncbi:hypothetical protein [Burkholderia pseudomultivorans]|uniref:hypothetical protein n=1 Tax=Burkholderia pseudomultivorans TaxID=1207504 RepID=UPI00188F0851|nr:hypothetical protein [Burkholderia pseudomultivorans]MBF5014843.1 hypothetical protein [Burkholderia pseudomultivorans]